ncbi:MAG: sugar ABC transporter ATP-binding protein [Firmicutes bacterium]|nr:sugar ABC transporter ATP-binding protein [Bacillota bacterium]
MEQVRLDNISKDFGMIRALNRVNLTFPAGKVTAVVGENGAGKSTLMKILMGVIQPDTGTIYVDNRPVSLDNPMVSRRLGFAAVFQEPLVFPYLSVLENLFIGHLERNRWGNVDRRSMKNAAGKIMDKLGLPETIMDQQMRDLSLGYQQLVLIAQSLLQNSRLIIFDEPTAILSAQETAHLFQIIRSLKESGHIVLYVSHRLDELSEIADRAAVLTDGQVVAVYEEPSWSSEELVEKMSGQRRYSIDAGNGKESTPHAVPSSYLVVKNLTNYSCFQDITFEARSSEIIGFYGQVGAGRSELMQALFGMRQINRGQITLNDEVIKPKNPRDAMSHGIAYLPEDRGEQGLFLSQSILRNTLAGNLDSYNKGGLLKLSSIRVTTDRLIRRLAIKTSSSDNPVGSLSGGGQQKVLFARWLARQGMRVMIFDEPTRGIDVATKREIHELIKNLAQEGYVVITVSSDLPEILALSTRIYVMREGRIVAQFVNYGDVREGVLKASLGISINGLPETGVNI